MQKYIALIVAVLVIIFTLLAGFFGILPTSEVNNVIQLTIAFILGHVVSLGQLHYAAYLDRRRIPI